MMKYTTFILIGIILIGGFFTLTQSADPQEASPGANKNVSMTAGQQVVEITAKGGFKPRMTIAKANTPTILKMKTQGTFDCSSTLVIPSIGYRNSLPSTGETQIPVPPQKPGTTLQGLCGMGMYSFQIAFS